MYTGTASYHKGSPYYFLVRFTEVFVGFAETFGFGFGVFGFGAGFFL